MNLRLSRKNVGILGAVVGAAAGVAAGVAAERFLVRRSRTVEDPYVDEPFGDLASDQDMTVTTDSGIDLHVEIVDNGSLYEDLTVIFVHGFCLDMGTFHFQRVAFDGQYRMVFYDQPGHGQSGKLTTGDYTLEDLASALAMVIHRAAPTGRIMLVGHSMGGMTIMAFAERYPEMIAERVCGIAFLSTSAGQMRQVSFGMPQFLAQIRGPLIPVVRSLGPAVADVVDGARGAAPDLTWLLTRKYGFGSDRPSPALISYVEKMNSATSIEVMSRYLKTIHGHDRILALEALRSVRVLVLCGDHDVITPLEHSQKIAHALPEARLAIIKNAGHVAVLEHSDEVNEVLGEFFADVA